MVVVDVDLLVDDGDLVGGVTVGVNLSVDEFLSLEGVDIFSPSVVVVFSFVVVVFGSVVVVFGFVVVVFGSVVVVVLSPSK